MTQTKYLMNSRGPLQSLLFLQNKIEILIKGLKLDSSQFLKEIIKY